MYLLTLTTSGRVARGLEPKLEPKSSTGTALHISYTVPLNVGLNFTYLLTWPLTEIGYRQF